MKWLHFNVSGSVGPDYSVLASTNLVNWTLLQTTNPLALPYLFMDLNWTNYPRRFYRVQISP